MGLEDPLEEELATHSSILTWKILWIWEPGRPESLGLPHSQARLSMHTHTEYEIILLWGFDHVEGQNSKARWC